MACGCCPAAGSDGPIVSRVVIRHSFGGLIAQMLAGRGLAKVTIAIEPAPFRGVWPLPATTLMPVLGNPQNRNRAVPLSFEQFQHAVTEVKVTTHGLRGPMLLISGERDQMFSVGDRERLLRTPAPQPSGDRDRADGRSRPLDHDRSRLARGRRRDLRVRRPIHLRRLSRHRREERTGRAPAEVLSHAER